MAVETKPLCDFVLLSITGIQSGIRVPPIDANNFEIKPATISLFSQISFRGLPNEDPYAHVASFLEICETFKINGATSDAIKLRCFPFTLKERAKDWATSMPQNSMTTWDEVAQNFLSRFYPPAKTARMRNEISNFYQFEGETLYEAWERFKELIRKCPHHGIQKQFLVQNFYNGLIGTTRTLIDAAAGGTFMNKNRDEAWSLLEQMALNNFQWSNERGNPKKPASVHEIDAVAALTAQVQNLVTLNSQMMAQICKNNSVNVNAVQATCDHCGGSHNSDGCQFVQPGDESVNYIANNCNNPYSNSYNPGWRNHPNFSWSNNQNNNRAPQNQAYNETKKENKLEDILWKFMESTQSFFNETRTSLNNQATAIKNLELQMGQMAEKLTERQPGN